MADDLPTDIAAICAMQDGALRNLYITQRYHDLSRALADVISADNVNWSTFATWASKTAGESIRNEEVPPFVVDLVGDAGDDVVPHFGKIGSAIHALVPTTGFHTSFLLAPVKATLVDVSSSIARGNLKVFAELAPEFVRFVQTFRGDAKLDEAKLDAYLSHFKPGDAAQGGQDFLKAAFDQYYRARFDPSATSKARSILYANCMVGLHEQTRLQPEIQIALDAPIDVFLKDHIEESVRQSSDTTLFGKIVNAIAKPLEDLTNEVEKLWERIATRYLMRLSLPYGEELPLGKDIPASYAARDFLPVQLQNITLPEELVTLLAKYDRARGDSDAGSASVDWAHLDDRMNFIVNLFRSSQQDKDLFSAPFEAAQVAAFSAGKIPAGKL
jgi:hypothetical protein